MVATVLTDSVEMYRSRIAELREEKGEYRSLDAAAAYASSLTGQGTANMLELTWPERKRVHNLKYYTWVEQQGRTVEELNDQWYRQENNFLGVQKQAGEIDDLINDFNERTGLLKS